MLIYMHVFILHYFYPFNIPYAGSTTIKLNEMLDYVVYNYFYTLLIQEYGINNKI